MSEQSNDLLEILLRECAAAAPEPWYPSDYVRATGMPRAAIDADLDRLRLGGLLRLTDWVQGKGQGYALTPEGAEVLQNPRLVERLREDGVAPQVLPPPLRRVERMASTWERGEAVRSALINPTRPVVTVTLLAVNIMLFFAGMFLAMREDVPVNGYLNDFNPPKKASEIRDKMGGLTRRAVVLEGEWWRLVGYCFVHGGLMHILFNMYFLYSLGPLVERMWGSSRFLILYLVSGLGGGCAAVIFNPMVLTIGASGALCGLLASMAIWVVCNRPYLPPAIAFSWLRGILTNVLLIVFISMLPGVSAWGHFGGGLAGAVVAFPLVYSRFGLGLQRWLGAIGVVMVPMICLGLVFWSITDKDRVKRTLIHVQTAATSTLLDYAAPLLQKDGAALFEDPTAIERALREFAVIEGELKTAQAELGQFSFADPDMQKAMKIAHEYVASWSRFYEGFSKILQRRTPPTARERDMLERELQKAHNLPTQLKNSALFGQ